MSTLRPLLWIILFFLVISGPLAAQPNPFLGGSRPPESEAAPNLPSLLPMPEAYRDFQRQAYLRIQEVLVPRSPGAGAETALWTLFILGVAYGLVHSALPGHQKVLVATFFATSETRARDPFMVGGLFALTHALGSLALVGIAQGLAFLWNLGTREGGGLTQGLNDISLGGQWVGGLASLALGAWLLVQKTRALADWRRRQAQRIMGKLLGLEETPWIEGIKRAPAGPRQVLGLLLSAGLVPCPGTLMVLFLGFGAGSPALALWGALAISLGLGIFLVLVAFLARWGRLGLGRLDPRGRLDALGLGAELAAALVVMASGLALLA